MPRYLIHIGPHKTGTTALQSGFRRHRDDLLKRGIYYPEHWYLSGDNSTHLPLTRQLRSREKCLEQEFNELNNSTYSHILISSEDLVDLPWDSIVYFKHIIGDSPVDVVFYCRNWSSLIQSASQEAIKQGRSTTVSEFFANTVINAWDSRVVNFSLVLSMYAKTFKMPNIRLVSYDQVAATGNNLLQHFLQTFANWDQQVLLDDARLNVSLDPIDVEIIRVLNMIAWARNRSRGIELRDKYLSHKSRLNLKLISESMCTHLASLEMDENAPPLYDLHRHIFDSFGHCMVDPKPESGLFTPMKKQIKYVSQEYIFEPGVFQAIQSLYDQLSM